MFVVSFKIKSTTKSIYTKPYRTRQIDFYIAKLKFFKHVIKYRTPLFENGSNGSPLDPNPSMFVVMVLLGAESKSSKVSIVSLYRITGNAVPIDSGFLNFGVT